VEEDIKIEGDILFEEDVPDEEYKYLALLPEEMKRNKKKLALILEEPIKKVPTLMVRSLAEYLVSVAY
jgi:hypothetical protein